MLRIDVASHMTRRFVTSLTIVAIFVIGVLLAPPAPVESAAQGEITYTVDADRITISTPNMTVVLSTLYPAAVVFTEGNESEPGDGFVLSAILGYNQSMDNTINLSAVPYHAPLDNATWTLVGPVEETETELGHAIIVTLTASVDVVKKPVYTGGGGSGGSGSGGSVYVEDWANVTVQYVVTTRNYSQVFDQISESPAYPVNGTTEIKFDVDIEPKKPLDVDRLALDFGLMKMDNSSFEPSTTVGAYLFRGYQANGVTVSDPSLNETDGTTPIMHEFTYRYQYKQMFSYVNETNVTDGFFSWASQVLLRWSGTNDTLVDASTYYRTDGESLRVYVAVPLDVDITRIVCDPSLGVFTASTSGGGGVIDYPDGSMIGSSVFSITIGAVIGAAIVGGASVYVFVRKGSGDEDPADVVSLEKNRYYRGGR
jgi:hypothetical protein